MSVPAQRAEPSAPADSQDQASTGHQGATAAQETPADPTPSSIAATPEQETKGPDFFRQAFMQIRGYTQNAAPTPAKGPEAPQAPPASGSTVSESERPASSSPPANGTAPSSQSNGAQTSPATTLPQQRQAGRQDTRQQQAPATVQLTEAEYQRRVQAEADRIIAKRQADEQANATRVREVELRRTNPFEYAQLMEDKDRQLQEEITERKRLTDLSSQQLHQYDRAILDTFVGALPEALRQKVIEANKTEAGIPGRGKLANETLKSLRQIWTEEGRASARAALMKDPTVIKEILARHGGGVPEPEAVQARPPTSSATPTNGNEAVNSWMRTAAQGTRQTSGVGGR